MDTESLLIGSSLFEEVGDEMVQRKAPKFLYSKDFPFKDFKRKFDLIVIHSLFIHMPLPVIKDCLVKAREVCMGKTLFTYKIGPTQSSDDWVYPSHLTHSTDDIFTILNEVGFKGTLLKNSSVNFRHQWVSCE